MAHDDERTTEIEAHRVHDIYSGVRGIAVKILNRVERTDSYLDKLLDYNIKNNDLSSADKAFLYELVHGVVRWMGRLDWILSGFYKGQFSKALPILKNALRVALYQIMFLDRVPEYAVVNEAVEFVKKLHGEKPGNITNAVLRNILRSKNALRYPSPSENLVGFFAAYYSHPSWLVKRWIARYGKEETEALLRANNEKPKMTLRVNTLKSTPDEMANLLNSVDLEHDRGAFLDEFFTLHNLTNIRNWEYFEKGHFTVQDESAGFAARALDPKPGMRVVDLCAAPGGKTSHIAELMRNEGKIVAIDRFEVRMNLLLENMGRLGVTCVASWIGDALEYPEAEFDRALVDAPCSGLGTLSKKPEIKWKKDLLEVRRLNDLQLALLNKAASMIKPDGAVVYSTCTTEPEENENIVRRFLAERPEFRLVPLSETFDAATITPSGCVQTLPNRHGVDGAFVAKFEKIR
ncbi:MAG: 16S rRNA (cytosine(967)-C(5))-methyltransferase RsmB [Ignavibacteriales bacterium]|nr:16S rRNA (cytosine(967)-C(5))-methyltransferase RsmB [Ignavibacteriales bacterium]